MKSKSLSLIFTITLLTALCFSCSAQTEAQKNDKSRNANGESARKLDGDEAKTAGAIDTSHWKVYKDAKNGFSFRYPATMNVEKTPGGIRLYHVVKYSHQDPCAQRDDAPTIDKLTDFDITFKIISKNFQSYKWAEEDSDSDLKLGKTDADGKIVSRAYDGCGYDEYIYSLGAGKTFVAEYKIIGLFSPVYADFPGAREALQHPDLLKNEEEIVKAIFESFEFVKK